MSENVTRVRTAGGTVETAPVAALLDAVLAATAARLHPPAETLPPPVPGETRTVLPALPEGCEAGYEVSVNQSWLRTGTGRPLYVFDPVGRRHPAAADVVCTLTLVHFSCREDAGCGRNAATRGVRQVTRGPLTVVTRPRA